MIRDILLLACLLGPSTNPLDGYQVKTYEPINWTAVGWRQAMDDREDTQDTRLPREKDLSLIRISHHILAVYRTTPTGGGHGLFTVDANLTLSYGKSVVFLQFWFGPWYPNGFIWLNGTDQDVTNPKQEVIDAWKKPKVWFIHGWSHKVE